MISLIKSELYELKKPFYRKYLIAYLIFYLLFPVFFWFFGRVHAEQAFQQAKGIDFFVSMPHYLEYALIWLPILASKFFVERNSNSEFFSLIGYNRTKIFFSKIISFYIICLPLMIIRMFVFPLEWSYIFMKGTGIEPNSNILSVTYFRYFGNLVNQISIGLFEVVIKTIVFQLISYALVIMVVIASSLFSSDKVASISLSLVFSFAFREGLVIFLHPSENSNTGIGQAYYKFLTNCIYLLDWNTICLLMIISGILIFAGLWWLNKCYSKHDMK